MAFEIENGKLIRYIEEKGVTDVIIPDEVKIIDNEAFFHCRDLRSIVISSTVKEIGERAFEGCDNLESVIISKGVEVINKKAFYNCMNLKSVIMEEGVYKIRFNAFGDCKNLENIVIPKSVESIGVGAFMNTKWLEDKSNENPLVIVNDIVIDGKKCKGEVVLPEGTKEILGIAFIFNYNLENIVIPKSVKKIGEDAFNGTPWLKNKYKENPFVIINDILVSIDSDYFKNGHIIIPKNVHTIVSSSSWKFYNTEIESVVVHDGITYIGDAVFSNVKNIIVKYLGTEIKVENQKPIFDNNKFLKFIYDKTEENFSKIVNKGYKIPLAFLMTASNSDPTGFYIDFLKKNKFYAMKYLIDMGDIENLLKLLPLGFVNAENVDELVMYANEKKQTEIQMKLMNYKHDYIGYDNLYYEFEI